MGIGVAVSMVAAWPACVASDGPPAVAVKATPSFCIALASASGTSARTTVRIKPEVADNVLKGVSYDYFFYGEKERWLYPVNCVDLRYYFFKDLSPRGSIKTYP